MAWTSVDIERTERLLQTYRVEDMRRSIADYDADPLAVQRQHRQECRACFYLFRRVAGQAFTPYTCRECGEEHQHPNTATPKLCQTCADARTLCRHCGGPRETYSAPPRRRKAAAKEADARG